MEIAVFFWFVFAIVVGVAANARGRDGVGWFFLALIISPVLALILLLKCNRAHDLFSDTYQIEIVNVLSRNHHAGISVQIRTYFGQVAC